MKKVMSIFGAILFGSIFLLSCKTTQVAKFASVENVIELKINNSLEEVISKLGSKPYNIYSNQKEGYTIYTYKYKVVERKVNPKLINRKGGETNGTEVYNGKEHTLFLLFKDGKLESFVTTDGRKDSNPLIMLNNTLYTISMDKGKYIIMPTSTEEPNSGSSMPFGKKKKK
jgi:hypothetical protein